jgi:hypothetical protein
MIALLVALLSTFSGAGSHAAVYVNAATPAAVLAPAVKATPKPSTGHPLAG